MGTLAQGFGAFATGGAGTAASAANQSLTLGTMSTGMNVAGNLLTGVGQSQQYGYAARVQEANAQAALEAGQNAESQSKLRYGGMEARQKADQAANGVGVGSGSPLAVRQSTETIGAMDAALIHYNAARQAFGDNTNAALDKAAASGALVKGLYGAGSSFLSGAASVGDKWQVYQRLGAFAKPGGSPMTLPGDLNPYDGSQ